MLEAGVDRNAQRLTEVESEPSQLELFEAEPGPWEHHRRALQWEVGVSDSKGSFTC